MHCLVREKNLTRAPRGNTNHYDTAGAADRTFASCGTTLFRNRRWARLGYRLGGRWLVFQNKEELPKFPPLPLYCGGFRLIELFVLLEFALRLRLVANPL